MLEFEKLQNLLEALLLAAGKPLTIEAILAIFSEEEGPSKEELRAALLALQENSENRGIELVEIASGYHFRAKPEWNHWVAKLWEEKAPRYSRALFETLALIAYRQPITRGEIEDIRGVSLSPSIFKTLLDDRQWIRIVGHREVPGRPALYATTKAFLDYFGLKNLEELPSLPEIMNLEGVMNAADMLMENELQKPKNKLLLESISEDEDEDDNELETEIETEIETETATAPEIEAEIETEIETAPEIDIEAEIEAVAEENNS